MSLVTLFDQQQTFDGKFSDAAAARRYIEAGRATITLRSQKTDVRRTYKIERSDDGKVRFVKLLTNPDNVNGYSYMGFINARGQYVHGTKSRIPENDTSAIAFRWTWERLQQAKLHPQLEVWHEGICGRCGRKLTVPSSVSSGFGPECVKRVGG
jgi:hypothetical protein